MIRFISSEGRRRCQKGPFPDVRNLAGVLWGTRPIDDCPKLVS